jgi:hypothetical protein
LASASGWSCRNAACQRLVGLKMCEHLTPGSTA